MHTQETNFVHQTLYYSSHNASLQLVSTLYGAIARECQAVIINPQRTEGGFLYIVGVMRYDAR